MYCALKHSFRFDIRDFVVCTKYIYLPQNLFTKKWKDNTVPTCGESYCSSESKKPFCVGFTPNVDQLCIKMYRTQG